MAEKQEDSVPAGSLEYRLHTLFAGNPRSCGQFEPATGKMHTEYRAATPEDFRLHLNGHAGLGVVPIDDSNRCVWAAIDVDNHGEEEDIPIAAVDQKIREHGLPLIACRSKSGGVHAYLFLTEPVAAPRIKGLMAKWAGLIGHAGAEVFPKQSHLAKGKDGKLQLGNWINMPYLGGDDTHRYAFHLGKRLGVAAFVALAEKSRASGNDLLQLTLTEHPQAPPCVQRMIADGVASGQRNEALFNITIYLRRAHPEGYQPIVQEMNSVVFDRPLGRAEMTRTMNSASRPDYSYRCNEEPMRSLCDRAACVNRKFGISKEQFEILDTTQELPPFTAITQYRSEPIRWEMSIDGVRVTNIGTEQLLDWRYIRILIAERLTRVVPMLKNTEWARILQPLMAQAIIIDTPDDASIAGVIRDRLRDFAAKTDLVDKGEDVKSRGALLRGLPVVQKIDGDRQVAFRAQDFINYLKRTRTEDLKGVNLWFAVKDLGVRHTKIRVGKHNINVWYIPVKEVYVEPPEPPEFKTDL